MRFSLEYLREVIPASEPPTEYVPQEVKPSLGLLRERDGEDVYRAGLWTYAMFSEMHAGRFTVDMLQQFNIWWAPTPFGIWRTWPTSGIGVFDQEFEDRGFGLVLMTPPRIRSGIAGRILFPVLAGASFPIACRSLVEDFHAIPSTSNAASACWVEDRTNQGQWGVLTCRHALSGVAVGANITLSNGATARVNRKAPATVDAAFLTTTAPHNLNRMNLLTYPVPGQSVRVSASSGTAQRSIVTITDTLGVLNDATILSNYISINHANPVILVRW